jgi:hypothetical protein
MRANPALAQTVQAARALVHFGPWRHAARAVIRWQRPPQHEDVARAPSPVSLNVPGLVQTLRVDGMAQAGQLPDDVVRGLRAITDDLPPGEYGDFHDLPEVRKLVLGADVLNVVRGYFGAEPVLLECNLVVGRADDQLVDLHVQRHFHFDHAGWQSLNLFVYLTDIEEDSGAHQVVIGTHRHQQVRDAIRPWVPEDEIYARYPDRVRTIAGPAGTMFFENTEAFHRRVVTRQRRAMLNVLFASHRGWLSKGRLTVKYSEYTRDVIARQLSAAV